MCILDPSTCAPAQSTTTTTQSHLLRRHVVGVDLQPRVERVERVPEAAGVAQGRQEGAAAQADLDESPQAHGLGRLLAPLGDRLLLLPVDYVGRVRAGIGGAVSRSGAATRRGSGRGRADAAAAGAIATAAAASRIQRCLQEGRRKGRDTLLLRLRRLQLLLLGKGRRRRSRGRGHLLGEQPPRPHGRQGGDSPPEQQKAHCEEACACRARWARHGGGQAKGQVEEARGGYQMMCVCVVHVPLFCLDQRSVGSAVSANSIEPVRVRIV